MQYEAASNFTMSRNNLAEGRITAISALCYLTRYIGINVADANPLVFARDIFPGETIPLRIVNVQKARGEFSPVLATKMPRSNRELVRFGTLESSCNLI